METTLSFWIYLFTAWLLYLVFQAIFINGIKLSAAGKTEIKPDGTEYDSDMILYPVSKLLLQKSVCKIFYNGAQLQALYRDIIKGIGVLDGATVLTDRLLFTDGQYLQFKAAAPILVKYIPEGAYFSMTDTAIVFYKEYDVYKYPAWIRKPLIQCIVCMGSFYGIFTFLIPVLVIGYPQGVPLHGIAAAYVVNTFMLACMNKIINRLV